MLAIAIAKQSNGFSGTCSPRQTSPAAPTGYKQADTRGVRFTDSWPWLSLPITTPLSVFESVVPRLGVSQTRPVSKDTGIDKELPHTGIKKPQLPAKQLHLPGN